MLAIMSRLTNDSLRCNTQHHIVTEASFRREIHVSSFFEKSVSVFRQLSHCRQKKIKGRLVTLHNMLTQGFKIVIPSLCDA